MDTTVISPSGRTLRHRTTKLTTSRADSEAKIVPIKLTAEDRLAENREYLKNPNMLAFLKAIAAAEGGDYDFKYGAIKGRRNDPWRFTDYSTHPGPRIGGKTTAAGMYQINQDTWKEMGGNMGLTDFSPDTQDLIAVEILRLIKAAESVKSGDINAALGKASRRWSALPQGKGQPGYYPKQPSVTFESFERNFKNFGGVTDAN